MLMMLILLSMLIFCQGLKKMLMMLILLSTAEEDADAYFCTRV